MKNKYKIFVACLNGIISIISSLFFLVSNGAIKLYQYAEKDSYGYYIGYSQNFLDISNIFKDILLIISIILIILNIILIKKNQKSALWCRISFFCFGINILGLVVFGAVAVFSPLGLVSSIGLLLQQKE